ncbi:hypothetical protein FML86_20625, partial [Mycobacterium tuberculosis]
RSNSRLPTTLNARDQPPAEVSDQRVSGLTGAVHSVLGISCTKCGQVVHVKGFDKLMIGRP